jgi:DNA-binding MarR family transcriptional regulator
MSDTGPRAAAVERLYGALVREGRRRDGGEPEPQLTPTQRLALVVVTDDGPLRLGALAGRLGTSDSAATRAVDTLVAAGLAGRVPDPHDGRGVLVDATPAGRARVANSRRLLEDVLGSTAADLGAADRERLVDLLGRLAALLEDGRATRSSGS